MSAHNFGRHASKQASRQASQHMCKRNEFGYDNTFALRALASTNSRAFSLPMRPPQRFRMRRAHSLARLNWDPAGIGTPRERACWISMFVVGANPPTLSRLPHEYTSHSRKTFDATRMAASSRGRLTFVKSANSSVPISTKQSSTIDCKSQSRFQGIGAVARSIVGDGQLADARAPRAHKLLRPCASIVH